jgi:plastocyanin
MKPRKMRGRAGVTIVAVALTAAIAAGPAQAAKTVLTRGGIEFAPNQYIRDTLRFVPGKIIVRPNERVTWVDGDQAPDPHTITVVAKRNMPSTLEEVFECRICSLALAHLADPENPESSEIAALKVNVGKPGLNAQGDSLFLVPGGRISARVTASVGRTLHYLCAIHPWMQGSIRVTRTGTQPHTGHQGPSLTGRS